MQNQLNHLHLTYYNLIFFGLVKLAPIYIVEQLYEHQPSFKPCIVLPKEKGENKKERNTHVDSGLDNQGNPCRSHAPFFFFVIDNVEIQGQATVCMHY